MTENAPVAGYEFLGRVADSSGVSVGTCFQVEPGVLVTAYHVLSEAGAAAEGNVVRVGPVAGGRLHDAVVVRTDDVHDLAVLRTQQPLPHSRLSLTASDAVRTAEEVKAAGYAQVEDDGHEYALLPAGGKWRGPVLRDGLLWARIQADAVMPGMSGAPVLRVADGHVVGVVSARYRSQDEFLNGSVWVARVEDLIPLLDGVTQAVVNDLRPVGAAQEPASMRPARLSGYDSMPPPMPPQVPPQVFALGMFSVGLAAAAMLIGARHGSAPASMIISPVLVSLLLSICGVVSRWLDPDSRSGIQMWALGTVLLISSVNSGMMLPPDAPGRSLIVLFGVPAFWQVLPIGIRLFLGLPTGVLHGAAERWLVATAFSLGTAAGAVMLVTKTAVPACANWCGQSPVRLVDDADLYLTIRSGLLMMLAGLAVVALFLLVLRVRRSTPIERMRSRNLVVLATTVAALYLATSLGAISFYSGLAASTDPWAGMSLVLGWVLALGLLMAFLITLARRPVMQFRLQNLIDHPAGATLQALERSVGLILRDSGFRILEQHGHGWRDTSGSPVRRDGQNALTPVLGDPPTVVLLHDRAYLGDRYLLNVIVRLVKARLPSTAGYSAAG